MAGASHNVLRSSKSEVRAAYKLTGRSFLAHMLSFARSLLQRNIRGKYCSCDGMKIGILGKENPARILVRRGFGLKHLIIYYKIRTYE